MSDIPIGRRGRALCIGVEAEDDARTFSEIAMSCGFHAIHLLLGERATLAAVRASIDALASDSEPGDLVMLTFSGHGGRKSVPTRHGAPEALGVWQLYDGSLNDGQIESDLAQFREGVRVLVISDNCNGGLPSLQGSAPNAVSASVIVLAACQHDRYADGAGLPGHFADALLRTWNRGAFEGAYPAFHRALCERMPSYQQPDFYRLGRLDARFEAQRPFTIALTSE